MTNLYAKGGRIKMAKKEKIRKKTDEEKKTIDRIKWHLNQYASKSNTVRSIEFNEETDGTSLRFIAKLDYGSFEQRITYYPFMLFREQFIDVEFSFEKSDYVYTFYDIFNLFDIDDYNLYFYDDVISSDDVKYAVKDIIKATEKYSYYLEKAQTEEYLPRLEKNYETDMNNATRSDDWMEDDEDGFILPLNHPIYSFADGQITGKTLKRLRKKNAKGKLDTIYEKRLLEYLESGKEVSRKAIANKADFTKIYKLTLLKVYIVFFAASLIPALLLTSGFHAAVFSGATTFGNSLEIFGVAITFSYQRIFFSVACALLISVLLIKLFGTKFVKRVVPEAYGEKAAEQFEKDFIKEAEGKMNGPITVIGCIFIVALIVASVVASASDVGYYEDRLKFSDDSRLTFSEIAYDELEIYKVRGYYENDEYFLYENAYAIRGGEDYFEYGECVPNGQTQTKLEEIAEKYSKEIKEIKSIEDLYENSGD